ncbi:MAG: valine--pyruvate transaminase [Steroidobacteraceae bacterium]
MKLSRFGERFCRETGIVQLMDDIGTAIHEMPDAIMMGGGNPSRIAGVEATIARHLQAIAADGDALYSALGTYQPPQGDPQFLGELAAYLRKRCGWRVNARNLALLNGSQSVFFILFNMFAGSTAGEGKRRVCLPLVPEYIGYTDAGLEDSQFVAIKPRIELQDEMQFKYRVEFAELRQLTDVGTLCLSRPTNPTGNVHSEQEIEQLDAIARDQGVPLIIDGAYGLPFPGIVFTDARAYWNDNIILVLSLSKLGLPGARTGIVVANEDIATAVQRANAIISLATGNIGPALGQRLLASGELDSLCRDAVRPFYASRLQFALEQLRKNCEGLPLRIHKPEGGIFLWLWFEGLPGGSAELYRRLRKRGVLVIPGGNFFPGLDAAVDWPHRHECIRMTYGQDREVLARGVEIIASEVRHIYAA